MLSKRLQSLDFLRGFIMVLLALESAGLHSILYKNSEGTWFHSLAAQLHHHEWNGLHFWDLIQPCFMFIAGTAMAYSIHSINLCYCTYLKLRVSTVSFFVATKKLVSDSNCIL